MDNEQYSLLLRIYSLQLIKYIDFHQSFSIHPLGSSHKWVYSIFHFFHFLFSPQVWGEYQLGWLLALPKDAVLQGQPAIQQPDPERQQRDFLDHQFSLLHQANTEW